MLIKLMKQIIKKIICLSIIIILFCLIILAKQSLAAMDSGNYNIWLDNFGAGGGSVESANYQILSNISGPTGAFSESLNFRENPGFSGINDEPTVGFNVESVSLNFGELSTSSTAYFSHSFSAYTNSASGYTIRVYGDPLKSNSHILSAIGQTPAVSQTGAEQFGINLVANTVPIVGHNPEGGSGQAAVNYGISNNFAYNDGDIVAQADNFTYQTDYTVSVIINIADETPAGIYGTVLMYEFIPIF